jgi:Tol biopolymer transport system component
MIRVWGIFGLLALCSCSLLLKRGPEKPREAVRPTDGSAVEDLRDNAIGANAAEPPWRDLVQHTRIPGPGRILHPGASRDGKWVAYASTEFGPKPQIVVRETHGAAPLQITQNGAENLFPKISPCGKRVAWASNRDGNFDLYIARLDAPTVATQVTFDSSDDVAPSWSPDGRRLAYCSRKGPEGAWQIVIVDVGSRIRTFLGAGMYPDWSPDAAADWICFQSQPRQAGGRSGVWVVHSDGTELREVVGDRAHAWSALHPRFSPDGRWIAYATVRKSPESRAFGGPAEADDIWLVRPDGTFDTRLTDDLSAEWWPAWGGDRVFFVSNRDGGAPNLYSVRVKPLEDVKE